MERYKTEAAKVNAEMPRNTRKMTAKEIVAYGRDHFQVSKDYPFVPTNKFTIYMQAVASAIFDPENWKNPIYATFPGCGMEWAKAAIIWYHGAEPMESFIGVYSNGYACY